MGRHAAAQSRLLGAGADVLGAGLHEPDRDDRQRARQPGRRLLAPLPRWHGLHHPVFIPATARPDRDAAWLEQKRRTMLPDAFSTEYAQTWEQAIAGSGGHVFTKAEIDAAVTDARPLCTQALRGRKYVIAWDIGSRHDHSVGIVLDVTEDLFDVAHYIRLRGDYPLIQQAVDDLHRAFGGHSFTVIEGNSIGTAVAENVTIPEHQLRRFTTAIPRRNGSSKRSASNCRTS